MAAMIRTNGSGSEAERKLHRMHVEAFDAAAKDWRHLGSVLLPNRAGRLHVAHALRVFGLNRPTGSDRVSWSFMTMPGPVEEGPRYLPKVSIFDLRNVMIVRLSPHVRLPGGQGGSRSRRRGRQIQLPNCE